jgi:mRNA-degrading endonuclease RelE of RelBE toxin-antitoxin system
VSKYRLWIEDEAKSEIRNLPGHVRQRIKRIILELAENPRPHSSRTLEAPERSVLELRRIRLDKWRILYAIDEEDSSVGVYGIRQRPPYDYEDLGDLFGEPKQ